MDRFPFPSKTMKHSFLLASLCLATNLPLDAAVDSWGPFQSRRIVAKDGRTCAVLRRAMKGSTLGWELCERRAGVPPITAASSPRPLPSAIGHPELPERLADILERGSTQDGRIALYFGGHPRASAVPALRSALARYPAETTERAWIERALAACSKER